jgi:hypothetical protein
MKGFLNTELADIGRDHLGILEFEYYEAGYRNVHFNGSNGGT